MLNPLTHLQNWLEEAEAHPDIAEPHAMALATATKQAMPSVRNILLKGLDERGLVFYTNDGSMKGQQLADNPQAAICFYWMPLARQVRTQGQITPVSAEEADAYFASRHRKSQLGAWASKQSQPLDSRETFEKRIAEMEQKYEGQNVPRPPFWNGWRLTPDYFEFWEEKEFRLHHREIYTRNGDKWQTSLLYP